MSSQAREKRVFYYLERMCSMHKYMKIVCLAIIVCIMPIAVHADVICFEGGSAESEKQTIEIKNSGGYMSVV